MIHILEDINRDEVIWRYMDFPKLESLLNDEAVYFASAMQFGDEWEGAITAIEQRRRVAWPERALQDTGLQTFHIKSLSKAFRQLAMMTKISCWYASEYESEAMWKLHVRQGKGIAICTTVRRLADSLRTFRLRPEYGEEDIFVGRVQYLDYDTEKMPNYCVHDSMLNPFFFKRKNFGHEREVRAALPLRKAHEWGVDIPVDGVLVPADLEKFVTEVRLAPGSGDQETDTVCKLLKAKGLLCPLLRSEMDRKPTY